MKDLKFKDFEYETELLDFVNANKSNIEILTITAQGMTLKMYGLFYYE